MPDRNIPGSRREAGGGSNDTSKACDGKDRLNAVLMDEGFIIHGRLLESFWSCGCQAVAPLPAACIAKLEHGQIFLRAPSDAPAI